MVYMSTCRHSAAFLALCFKINDECKLIVYCALMYVMYVCTVFYDVYKRLRLHVVLLLPILSSKLLLIVLVYYLYTCSLYRSTPL